MVLATSKALPALAGLDRLLSNAEGSDYKTDGAVRQEAGRRVSQEMKDMGFIEHSVRELPHGSFAANGKVFKLPPT